MKDEIWRDVKGYEGHYKVSNLGRVRSLKYGKERVLKPKMNRKGYLCVSLCKNGKYKHCKVHRLVAIAFIPNPDNLPCINHIDECKNNNIETNLEWCDAAYNTNYGTGVERRAKKLTNRPDCSKRVYQYTKSGAFVRSYASTHEAARQSGIKQSDISRCCLNKPKHHTAGGYIWRYNSDC